MVDDRRNALTMDYPSLTSESGQLDEMLTAKELAKLLKISVKTIYRYVLQGLIPYIRIRSNVRFPKRQIMQWIAHQNYRP